MGKRLHFKPTAGAGMEGLPMDVAGASMFEDDRFGKIRTVEIDGEPWFVAKDVCDCLGLGNSRQATLRLDEDEKGVISNDTPGGEQEMTVVSEPGLYALIANSRKPEAKAFKRWVRHDVLPKIRKTGSYSMSGEPLSPAEMQMEQARRLLAQAELTLKHERMINELRERQENADRERGEMQKRLDVVDSRLDSMNGADIEGDDRQKFRSMINLYAVRTGVQFGKAYQLFATHWNTAYRTNFNLCKRNYMKKHQIKKMTGPEYLEATGQLGEAVLIADKMLSTIPADADV